MQRSIAEKLGIKKDMRVYFLKTPDGFMDRAAFPEIDLKTRLSGKFDYIHFFAITQNEFQLKFKILKQYLKPSGMLWISWPKSGQNNTDLSITKIIKLGYDDGLVESKTISIDEVWSAIKFTHPKKGKKYENSYGSLK